MNYTLKTIRVSEKSHFAITKLAEAEKLFIKDYIERLSLFLLEKGITINELSTGNISFSNDIDRVIKIIKSQERNIFVPILKAINENLYQTSLITRQIDFEVNEPEQEEHITESSSIVSFEQTRVSEQEYTQLKIEKERLELKVERAKEALLDIINESKLAKTALGSSRTRKFTEEELSLISSLIKDL